MFTIVTLLHEVVSPVGRSEVHAAVLLKIHFFADVMACHWVCTFQCLKCF